MIVKSDEEIDSLIKAIESVKDYVDGIFITCNNEPSKRVKGICTKYGAHFSFLPWNKDFSEQRNFNFKQAYDAGYDLIFWMDTDDTLTGGKELRRLAEEMPDDLTMYMATYNYAREYDYISLTHNRERLIRWNPNTMQWVGRVHEQIVPKGTYSYYYTEKIKLEHVTKNPEQLREASKRNLGILMIELQEQGDKPDPRTLIQIGRTLVGMQEYQQSIPYLERYIPLSGWDEERYEAICLMGYSMEMLGNYDLAEKFYFRGLMEMYNRYPAYEGIIRIAVYQKQWDKVIHWCETLFAIPEPQTNHYVQDMNVQLIAKGFYAFALIFTGKCEEGWRIWKEISKRYPEHEMVKENNENITKAYHEGSTLQSITKLIAYTQRYDRNRLNDIFNNLPNEFKHHPSIASLKIQTVSPIKLKDNEVTIYCGEIGLEDWAYPSILTGIGGSEEAVINLSRELTDLGYKVTVYNRCGDMAGEYAGVTYLPSYELNPNNIYNIFISWRDPIPLTVVAAKTRWLWLHDVPQADTYSEAVIKNIDKIVVLSEYHRSLLPNVPDDKIFISRNGVDLKYFDKEVERDSKRVIYTSSPERGLETFIEIASKVKAEVPDAKFECYYGWQNLENARGSDKELMVWVSELKSKIKELDIPDFIRLSHKQIVEKMMSSGIWFYPTDFPEISCIAAMKAQIAGAIPICSDYAALSETVFSGNKISFKNDVPDTEKLTTILIDYLKNPEKQDAIREKMMSEARDKFSWADVAKDWDKQWRSDETDTKNVPLV